MSDIRWLDVLGWSDEEIADLRFVGYSYIKQGHYETALKFFEALVVLCPDSAYDLQTLGAIHLQLGDNLSALNYLDKALKIEPSHGYSLLNRAKALFMLGYRDQGVSLAKSLSSHSDVKVANQADALLLAYA